MPVGFGGEAPKIHLPQKSKSPARLSGRGESTAVPPGFRRTAGTLIPLTGERRSRLLCSPRLLRREMPFAFRRDSLSSQIPLCYGNTAKRRLHLRIFLYCFTITFIITPLLSFVKVFVNNSNAPAGMPPSRKRADEKGWSENFSTEKFSGANSARAIQSIEC